MRNTPPTLAPIFRSDAQLRILGEIYCGPNDSYTLSELAAAADTSAATAGREVELLRANGIVNVTDGPGRSKLVSANWALPWAPDLRRILVHTGGLIPTLRTLLGHDPRIDAAYIFGSWARRYHGEPGHFPRDIDIVIVSDTSQFDLDIAWNDIARHLGIELNPVYRPSGYDPTTDTLIAGSPVVELDLHRDNS
ncbi:MAG: hypothetical protein H6513_14270 [Acidimicrobiaceae bacterium]|nr:hypothetical protein [Ilumatobacter sp.]MCB9381848.1 hypothetical protein [Acidimicrobiaceae bacterium]MCO5328746.1 nucleotidyltransferase domain-containing protein [Ilumatobacteraceae bacterium]